MILHAKVQKKGEFAIDNSYLFCNFASEKEKNMKKVKSFLLKVYHIPSLKYIVAALIAIVVVGFVDENSVWNHLRNRQRISELESEIKDYTDRYHHDQEQIRMLDSNPKAIEKIARERYFMKTDDEDVFVLSDDQESALTVNNESAK